MTYVAYACLMTVLLHMPISWLLCCKRLPQDLCYVCLSHDNCVTCTRRRSRKHNTGLVVLSLDTVWSATPRKHPRSNSECVCVFGGRGGRGALEFFYLVWMPGVGIAGDLSLCSRIPGYTGYISQAVLLLFLWLPLSFLEPFSGIILETLCWHRLLFLLQSYFGWFFISDELIRQVTINCAERGLLLLRVRDEIRMTIAAYQTLYESSVAFGMRKALQAEQGKADMENKVGKD